VDGKCGAGRSGVAGHRVVDRCPAESKAAGEARTGWFREKHPLRGCRHSTAVSSYANVRPARPTAPGGQARKASTPGPSAPDPAASRLTRSVPGKSTECRRPPQFHDHGPISMLHELHPFWVKCGRGGQSGRVYGRKRHWRSLSLSWRQPMDRSVVGVPSSGGVDLAVSIVMGGGHDPRL
jgi:hypothetical protein